MTRKQSNGEGTAPAAFWWKRSRSASVSDRVAMSPPITSEWPPRYFVAEWSTRSAPRSSGCWRYGVAKVLSTTVIAPATAASRATALMSIDLEQRVRRRLDPHHARRPLARERGRDRVEIGQVDRIGLDPVAAPDLVGQAPRAAVHVVAHEQPVARIEQEADALGRRQARGEGEPMAAVLEGRDRFLERGARRVAGTPVLVAAAQPADAVLLERGAHLDRGHHRAGLRVGLGAGVHREGLESVRHRRSFLHGRAADPHPVA